MSKKKKTQTHSYAYDPLDRHVISQGANADNTQLFYCRDRVATEHRGNVGLRIFECEEAVLSYQVHQNGTPKALLIAGEENRSTLTVLNNSQQHSIAYTPYGHHLQEADTPQLLGFNGERFDPFTGYYLLGNGYRAFNPVLMRFNSPDSWSPFGKGGINAYAYCEGDPVNRVDPTGHTPALIKRIARFLGVMKPRSTVKSPVNVANDAVSYHRALRQELADVKGALSTSQKNERLLAIELEAAKSNSKDEIQKLNLYNKALLEANNKLKEQALRPVITVTRMPPSIPPRPINTLTDLSTPTSSLPREVDYLDLGTSRTAVRKT